LDDADKGQEVQLDPIFFKDIASARKLFNSELAKSNKVASLDILAWHNNHEDDFATADRTWDVDKLILEKLTESVGLRALKDQVLAAMPSDSCHKPFVEVDKHLQQIKEGALYRFVKAQSGPVASSMRLVNLAKRGALQHNCFTSLTGFDAEIGSKLQFFCSHVVRPVPKKMDSKRSLGVPALMGHGDGIARPRR